MAFRGCTYYCFTWYSRGDHSVVLKEEMPAFPIGPGSSGVGCFGCGWSGVLEAWPQHLPGQKHPDWVHSSSACTGGNKFHPQMQHTCVPNLLKWYRTVMILSFQTDMPGQTVQTQIRLLLEKQSDQGLHCLPFRLHHLDSLLYGRAT